MIMSRFIEAIRNGSADPWWDSVVHGGGKGGTPDYTGAANAQAQASKDATSTATWANRPTINTPWGTQSWEQSLKTDPATGQLVTDWTQNMTLSPEQQKQFDAQQAVGTGRSQAAQGLVDQATSATATPFDWNNLPGMPGSISDAQKSSYNTMEAALQPQRDRQRAQIETQLANSGLPMDSQAYKNRQADLEANYATTDKGVMAQAMQQGINDTQAQQALRSSAIGEQMQKRAMPLNELNALLTGQQVNMPQMPSFAPSGTSQTPDLLGAAQAQQQANMANRTDWGSIAGGVGALGLGAAMVF